jgi:hypothetical protein
MCESSWEGLFYDISGFTYRYLKRKFHATSLSVFEGTKEYDKGWRKLEIENSNGELTAIKITTKNARKILPGYNYKSTYRILRDYTIVKIRMDNFHKLEILQDLKAL